MAIAKGTASKGWPDIVMTMASFAEYMTAPKDRRRALKKAKVKTIQGKGDLAKYVVMLKSTRGLKMARHNWTMHCKFCGDDFNTSTARKEPSMFCSVACEKAFG